MCITYLIVFVPTLWTTDWNVTTRVKKVKWKYRMPLYTSLLTAWVYLFMPLQQYGTAIFYRPLKAFVDILHEKIDSILVERFNSRLYIAAPKWCQHPQYHSLSSFLRELKTEKMAYFKQSCNLCSVYWKEVFVKTVCTFIAGFLLLIGGFLRATWRAAIMSPVH